MATIEKREDKAGNITYRVKIRLKALKAKNKPPLSAKFDKRKDAKDWATETEAAIRKGVYFKDLEAEKITLAEAIDYYIDKVLTKKTRSYKSQYHQLIWWKNNLGHYSLDEVTHGLIEKARDKLEEGTDQIEKPKPRKAATVNSYLAILNHVFTKVIIHKHGWLDRSPLQRVDKLKLGEQRARYLLEDERARLLAACKGSDNPYLYAVVVLALSTGARRMELLGLHWKDLDLNSGIITLKRTKNNKTRMVPLVGHALEVMKEHAKVRLLNSDLVFPGRNPKKSLDIRSSWQTALRRAGISDFRVHDLRHSSASYLAIMGASMLDIRELLGHSNISMTARYMHLTRQHTTKLIGAMSDKMFNTAI